MSATVYEHIKITPYHVAYIDKIKIVSKINEHTDAEITAVISEEWKDDPVYETTIGAQVKLLAETEENGVLFSGTVKKIRITQSNGVYYLYINAASNTVKMDIKLKSRSFQDKSERYSRIIKKITDEYPKGEVIDNASENESAGKFLMQYDETDWMFIKRLASFFNAGLTPHSKADGIQYSFGLPKGVDRGDIEQYDYSVTKEITDYLKEKENGNPKILEEDKISYEVETELFFNIGDVVTYKGKTLYVKESVIEMTKAALSNVYKLSTKRGCSVETLYNDKIIGLSIQGAAIKTARDEIKLRLIIDDGQDVDKAHFFKCSTMYTADGNSGLYCMPELGDTVYAYFPTAKEWEGVAQNSVRTKESESDKIDDPDVKYWRTKYGKEIKMGPKEVLITCVDNENYIRLNEDEGIDLFSVKPIKIVSSEDVSVESDKSIYLTAKKEINLTCKDSNVKMDGRVLIKGKEVRHN